MDQSRRAVESYWRSRMIDGATSDEDKVTPVYKLEEICELLRSSHVSIVKEVSEFIFKRLQHKSPIVKQKALRVIKYAVGKSGGEFRREMQRNSVAVKQLIHYKGRPDPLKGDSLNKAVRETAQEAVSAIFANEETKASTTENLGGRIQGFGNTNFDFVADDKKSSFLSDVVNIGSATIKQGLSTLTQSPSLNKNEVGTYKGPNLQRSLTTESNHSNQYGVSGPYDEDSPGSSRFAKNGNSANWGASVPERTGVGSHSSYGERTREERLLETIVTTGGVRLQPSRDALHNFLLEASKLDVLVLSHALESKLKSAMWQVRMKAICVLEALLKRKDDEHFAVVALYFCENKDLIITCSESPQASLREKAIKVLSLLDGEQGIDGTGNQEQKLNAEAINTQMPDLIDTGYSDNLFEPDEHKATALNNQTNGDPSIHSSPSIDELLGGQSSVSNAHDLSNDDPFADVSFHSGNKEDQESGLFSGLTVDKTGASEAQVAGSKAGPELFDIFGPGFEPSLSQNTHNGDVNNIMAGLSINESGTSTKQNGTSVRAPSEILFPVSSTTPGQQVPVNILNNTLSAQATNLAFPTGDMSYHYQPGLVLNPSHVPQPVNYNAMASMLAQQQFLATMSNFQNLGNLQYNSAVTKGEYSAPLPDVFNPSLSNQNPSSLMSSLKKEETKAFDFISDHLAAARDPKRVI